MEPIAELEDDEEGYDYDSPSGGIDSLNDSRNMMQFRSRSNTWPQFSSMPYDELAGDQVDDDTHELTDKGDLCATPYSQYESSYHSLAQEKGLHGLDAEGSSLYSNHHHQGAGGDFAVSHGEHTSTSTSTNLSSLHKGSPTSSFYSTAPSGASSLSRASNHFSSRNDELDTSPSDSTGLNGSHSHLHEAGNGAASASTSQSASAAAVAAASALKKNTSRRNAWGNMSYADLITQAINGSPEKRLTLSQIYEWMVQNVTYFKDKGDSNSSAGWKNSIRHNLSLHNRFMRVQNEGTGKSSWWMINPDAKPGKAARRRAISMETHNYEKRRGRVKRRVEQLRAAGMGCGHDPSALTTLSEYPLKSSESSLLMSSSSGSSSYKLAGSTSSLLSPQTQSLSNLCLAESGGQSGQNSAILVASPSSTDSYDPFSESSVNVVNHFHSNASNYSPGEFRPRTSSNASSTCSTVNHHVDNDNHQVPSLSPHAWTPETMRLYNSTANSYNSGLEQVGLTAAFRGSNDPIQLQLIDGLAALGTSSASAHNFRMMVEEEAELMHKNGPNVVTTCIGSTEAGSGSGSGSHSEMMLLGAEMTSGHGASGHSYNDLYKLQPTPQSGHQASISPSTSSPPSSTSSKAFTSLDSAPVKSVSGSAGGYFKSPSLEAGGKVHEINNNAAGGNAAGALLYDYHRYAEHQRSASLANLASYQHDPHHPGKMLGFMYSQESAQVGCYGAVYGGGEAQFSYYEYPEVSHEALNSLTYNSHSGGDLDLDFDTVCPQSGMLECDVDQVIRHELSVDGSLDFGLTSTETNADSTTSSTPTTPTSCSQNTYTMHTTERANNAAQSEPVTAHSPATTSMDIGYGGSPTGATTHSAHSFYGAESAAATQTYATLTSVATGSGPEETNGHSLSRSNSTSSGKGTASNQPGTGSSSSLDTACSAASPGLQSPPAMPLRPATVIYGPYSPTHPYLAGGHYLSVANPTSAAVVVAAAAETAVSVSVTSPVTVSGHHQQPVASRSWVH